MSFLLLLIACLTGIILILFTYKYNSIIYYFKHSQYNNTTIRMLLNNLICQAKNNPTPTYLLILLLVPLFIIIKLQIYINTDQHNLSKMTKESVFVTGINNVRTTRYVRGGTYLNVIMKNRSSTNMWTILSSEQIDIINKASKAKRNIDVWYENNMFTKDIWQIAVDGNIIQEINNDNIKKTKKTLTFIRNFLLFILVNGVIIFVYITTKSK